ncbi:hypothetical protein GE21DRAFT_1271548 [Neurospora crassa]|nr:hypothetical protein GE21DRAFT_1271548 [Neurospora crassa]
MSFMNEAFIANSARAVHPQSPSPFYFGDSSDFLCEQLANLCLCETYTNDELDAGNGLVFNPFQVARKKASINTTPPLKASPRSTSSYHTSSLHTSPYGTSACPTPSNGTASAATSPYTSPFQGTSPHLTPPYSNSTDIGHLDGKNELRENHVAPLDGNITMGQHNGLFLGHQPMEVNHSVLIGGPLANGIPACPHPHNYHLAHPREQFGTCHTCHKAIGNPLTGGIPIVAGTNGFPTSNMGFSHASGHINNFESWRKPCPVHSYSNTHLTQTKGQMKQSGAGGFLNGKSHGFNFHLGNLPPYPGQSMSRHPGSGHENPGCTPGNAKNLDGVGVHDDHRNNGELRHLAEFQNWVLGLDTSTMLRTAEQAGFPLDLGFKSNSSNHGRMQSTEGQGMGTTALTSTPRGYSAENNTATLHNFFAKGLPFRPAIASKRKCDDRSADKDAIWKTRSDAIAVPSLSGATPVAFTPVRAVGILPSSSSRLFAGSAKTRTSEDGKRRRAAAAAGRQPLRYCRILNTVHSGMSVYLLAKENPCTFLLIFVVKIGRTREIVGSGETSIRSDVVNCQRKARRAAFVLRHITIPSLLARVPIFSVFSSSLVPLHKTRDSYQPRFLLLLKATHRSQPLENLAIF